MKNQLRYVLYARKSTADDGKQIQSVPDQVTWANEFAKSKNVKLVAATFTEERSAKKPDNRPIFNELLKFIEDGHADAILCWEMSRLSRNPIDSAKVQWLLQQGIIKSILTQSREYRPEDNTIIFSVESGMNNQFIIDLRRNTRRGIRSKAAKGWFPHMAPIGYLNDKVNDKGEKKIFVDEERWHYVRRIWDLMLTGNYNPNQVLKIITDEGLTTRKTRKQGGGAVTSSGIYRILTNLFYTGDFMFNGEVCRGYHKSMITQQEFDYVQALLGKRGQPRPQKHEFAYTGLITCGECGCSITAESKTKLIKSTKQVKTFTYYRCTKKKRDMACKQKPIRLEDLESQIEPTVSTISILPEFKKWALKVLAEDNHREFEYRIKIQVDLRRRISSTEKELYDLNKTYSRGKLDDDFYELEKKDLKAKIKKLQKDLADSEAAADKQIRRSESAFQFACNARERFQTGNVRTRREILSTLSVKFTLTDRKLEFVLHKWIKLIADSYPELEAQLRVARTKKSQELPLGSSEIMNTWGE